MAHRLEPGEPPITSDGVASVFGIAKDLVERNTEGACDPKSRLEGGRIATLFDGDNSLAGHADGLGELFLRHLVSRKPKGTEIVGDASRFAHH